MPSGTGKHAAAEVIESEVEIAAIGLAGEGVGYVQGRPVFVPYAAPGDRLRIELQVEVAGEQRGRIIARLNSEPERAETPCPHFSDCGGCNPQHLSEPAYRLWKQDLVAGALARRGVHASIAPMLRVPPGSRRRATFTAEAKEGGVVLGFNAARSSRIVDLATCLLLTVKLRALLEPLRRALARVLQRGERLVAAMAETDAGIDFWLPLSRPLDETGRQALIEFAQVHDLARISIGPAAELLVLRRAPGLRFGETMVALPPGAFIQPTALGEAALVRAVTSLLAKRKQIADLYAGCGTFAFPLSRVAKVHAVEGDAAAYRALAAAAKSCDGRVTAEQRDLALASLRAGELGRFDAVVMDPPRLGAKGQVSSLAGSRFDLAVYVSCDPRDARILIDGGFRLERVLPIDQFPWTSHLELVGVFRR